MSLIGDLFEREFGKETRGRKSDVWARGARGVKAGNSKFGCQIRVSDAT
jgi:hypothetical protein